MLVQTCSHWIKLVQIGLNLLKDDHICPNWIKLGFIFQIEINVYELVHRIETNLSPGDFRFYW